MFIVGLTGGIGSGKTAVSDRFQALGITVVDADLASRTVVEKGRPALAAIAEHFGEQILREDGSLDRAALRQRVFADKDQRKWLEALLHPQIFTEIQAQLTASTSPYSILVSPLLVETGQNRLTQRILVVDVAEDIQLSRAAARDNNSVEQVKAIMAAQASREQRLGYADDTIVNDKGLDELDRAVEELHRQYLSMAKQYE